MGLLSTIVTFIFSRLSGAQDRDPEWPIAGPGERQALRSAHAAFEDQAADSLQAGSDSLAVLADAQAPDPQQWILAAALLVAGILGIYMLFSVRR